LSRFLHELLHRREIHNSLKPGLAPQHVIKFLYLEYFSASRQVIGAYAAPQAAPQICKTGLIRFSAQACTATLIQRTSFVPRLQKHAPYLSCHRDSFEAKAPGQVAGWLRQVPQPPFIAGPLGNMCAVP
jgi:hypothetical protein